MARSMVLCSLLAVAAASELGAINTQWCRPRPLFDSRGDVDLLFECPGLSPLMLLPYLWSPLQVEIRCPTSRYVVYTATNLDQLHQKVADKETAWCGLQSVHDSTVCGIQASPFATTLVGIKDTTLLKGLLQGTHSCNVTSESEVSPIMLVAGAAGLALFFAAGTLSRSFVFRISSGATIFMMTSVLLLLVFVFKMMPQKRIATVAFATLGSSSIAAVRWITGQWLPTWRQLVRNRWFTGYLVISALVGSVVTYLKDDMQNHKLNTSITTMLRLLALLLVYCSTWTLWPLSATVIGLLVASLLGPGVVKSAHHATARVQQVAAATNALLRTPFSARRASRLAVMSPASPGAFGTPLPEPSSGIGLSRMGPVGRWGLASAARRAHELEGEMETEATETEERDSLMPQELKGRTPLHLIASPPLPWAVRPRRTVQTFEEKMVRTVVARAAATNSVRESRQVGGRSGGTSVITVAARSGAEGGAEATRSGEPARSGGPASGSQAHGSARATLRRHQLTEDEDRQQGGMHETDASDVSPLVKSGHILNPASGRTIKIGGDVYNRLVQSGYTPDPAAGIMIAPLEY